MKTVISPEVNTAIWDLDGTLLDSFGILESLLHELLPHLGVEIPSPASLLSNFHGSLRDTFDNVFRGALTQQGIDTLERLFLRRQGIRYGNIENHLFSDALDLAARLTQRGVTQVLVTNRDHKSRGLASPRSIVERTMLANHIEHTVCGDDSEYRKPDKRVVEWLLGGLGVAGSEVVVIGDQYVDAELALNLGTSAIIVARKGFHFAHDKLTHADWHKHIAVVESLNDVYLDKLSTEET